MKADILGANDDEIGIQIFDNRDVEHVIHVGWNGDIEKHYMDEYPQKRDDRTLEEQKIVTKVEKRAKLTAQREFPDADILSPSWIPEELERAIQALQLMPVDEFADEFETCYQMITTPEAFEDVTVDTAQLVFQPFLVDDDTDEISYVPTPVIQYKTADGEVHTTHREAEYERRVGEPGLTKFVISLPPLEFDEGAYEFPDGFQIFLIEHLGAQIRDVYRHVGEQPPEPYSEIDLPGQLMTADDDGFYDDF